MKLYSEIILEYLIQEGKIEDIWTKYYSKDLTLAEFFNIIGLDPTTVGLNLHFGEGDDSDKVIGASVTKVGDYVKWIMTLYRRTQDKKMFWEDDYKVSSFLASYDKAKKENKLPPEHRDINRVRTLPELWTIVNQVATGANAAVQSKRKQQAELEAKIREKETKLVFEDSEWIIAIPKTYRASCLLGADTAWCTATRQTKEYFEDYKSQGPLYILKNKLDGTRYQFHLESAQFMDVTDAEIGLTAFFKKNPQLFPVFAKLHKLDNFEGVKKTKNGYALVLDYSELGRCIENMSGGDLEMFYALVSGGSPNHYSDIQFQYSFDKEEVSRFLDPESANLLRAAIKEKGVEYDEERLVEELASNTKLEFIAWKVETAFEMANREAFSAIAYDMALNAFSEYWGTSEYAIDDNRRYVFKYISPEVMRRAMIGRMADGYKDITAISDSIGQSHDCNWNVEDVEYEIEPEDVNRHLKAILTEYTKFLQIGKKPVKKKPVSKKKVTARTKKKK